MEFQELPQSNTFRLIDFEKSEVRPGFTGDWFLIVSGQAPCSNMKVLLQPLVYIRKPDYWGIEVVGFLPGGICLPTTKPFVEAIPLAGITGNKGVEVIGATKPPQKHDVPPGS